MELDELRAALNEIKTAIPPPVPEEADPAAQVGEKRARPLAEEVLPEKRRRGPAEWIVAFCAQPRQKQRYLYNVAEDRVAFHVEKASSEGLFIGSVCSSQNLWALVFEQKAFTGQNYLISDACLDKDWIAMQWKQGYFITAVAGCGNHRSLTVMSKGTSYTRQSYKVSRGPPVSWIKKKYREGCFVTSITVMGNKQWAVVASATTEYKDQSIELNCSYSSDRLHRLRRRGVYISAIATSPDSLAVVLSVPQNKDVPYQEVICAPNFPSSLVKERWLRMLYISSMSCGRTGSFPSSASKLSAACCRLDENSISVVQGFESLRLSELSEPARAASSV